MDTTVNSRNLKKILMGSLAILISLTIFIVCDLIYADYIRTNKMKLVAKENIIFEYGSNKVNLEDIVKKYDGDSIRIVNDVDTNVVGQQVITVEIEKSGVTKKIPVIVNVQDTQAPIIKLNSESVSVNEGESIDLINNIGSVIDNVDGNIEFINKDEVKESYLDYYTVSYDGDINSVGTHEVTIKAVDKNGNISEVKYNVNVVGKTNTVTTTVYNNLPGNGSSTGIVNLAYQLLGSRYVSGGNSPSGFDCSGFVQYVYAQNGYSISRSSTTQLNDGYTVSYENALPGDIISWGYSNGYATHSAVYVGNGMMIHAANPSQGVILSNIASWDAGSSDHILSVRRVL